MTGRLAGSMDRHVKAVNNISAIVRQFYDRQEKFRIYHGSTNSTRAIDRKRVVDTSELSHVLEVDIHRNTALVEPNVPMDRLVEETLKHGLIPPVIMEFPGITVGGGYAGTSGESSSFNHGFFDRTINYTEMVLANGKVVTCSDTENTDLFQGGAGAVGSLGVTTLVEIQLKEAKKYVEATYDSISSTAEAIEKIKSATADSHNDYVDGILFSKHEGAVITGRMTDSPKQDTQIQGFSAAKDPWFYLHVHDAIRRQPGPTTETIPLAEYLFRYDRGGFWVGASAFKYFHMPFNRYTRWFLDEFLKTRMLYKALHASRHSKKYIVQDLALPYATAEAFIEYTDKVFGIYPLWLCPLRQGALPTMHPHLNETEPDGRTLKSMLNIGLWGDPRSGTDDFVRLNRDLEHILRELGGMKWLYAHTFYTEEEFWAIYDRGWYDALREKYDAATLPSVFEKVNVNLKAENDAAKTTWRDSVLSVWPLGGLNGIRKAIGSCAYLQDRQSTWKDF